MRLTFLGTGDAFNGAGRAHSCYWITDATPQGAIAIDFGPTALMQLRRLQLEPNAVDWIALTHLHGDHIGGLPVLLIELWFQAKRTRPLTIAGPPGTTDRVRALVAQTYPSLWQKTPQFELRFAEWPVPGQAPLGPHTIQTIRARHDALAVATSFRLSLASGPVLVFSGDTGWQPELGALTDGADVFICECSNVEAGYWAHLSVEEIATHRADLKAKAVYLSHLSDASRAVAMQRAQALDVIVADDGMRLLL